MLLPPAAPVHPPLPPVLLRSPPQSTLARAVLPQALTPRPPARLECLASPRSLPSLAPLQLVLPSKQLVDKTLDTVPLRHDHHILYDFPPLLGPARREQSPLSSNPCLVLFLLSTPVVTPPLLSSVLCSPLFPSIGQPTICIRTPWMPVTLNQPPCEAPCVSATSMHTFIFCGLKLTLAPPLLIDMTLRRLGHVSLMCMYS